MPVQRSSMYLENAATVHLLVKRPKSPLELKKWIAKLMTEWSVECISPLEKKKIAARQAMLEEKAAVLQSENKGVANVEINDENNVIKVNDNEVKASDESDDRIGQEIEACNRNEEALADMEVLGPHSKFLIPSRALGDIDWSSASHATRSLLTAVFPREVLATHSLSGRPSPAFPQKPAKTQLDPCIIKDIIKLVKEKSGVKEEKNIRALITTKCADESKMLRIRERNQMRRHQLRRKINPQLRYSFEL